jgi:DNA polymerase-3 subunit gamma/tau
MQEQRSGEYVVVARRYRPQAFEELVGQEHVARALANAINSNRVGHAYLFTGARGVGKTSSARILAKALNCVEGPTPTPCNQCEICQSISSGDDVDVLELDGASNRGIEQMRNLRQNVNIRPSRARFKIYIIDEVHMLTNEAFNALLKTLEEPPEHVKFIFCTTEPEKIPITILSRCQRFDFAGIQPKSIVGRLRQIVDAEGVQAETEALEILARRAGGSMRDSQSLLEQLLAFGGEKITAADVHAMLGSAADGRLGKLVTHLVERDASAALADLDAALAEGVDVGQLLDQLLGYFRDVMTATVGCPTDLFLNASTSEFPAVQQAAKALGVETVLAVLQILDQTMQRLRYSTHRRTLVELALVRVCSLADLDRIGDLMSQLGNGAPVRSATGARPAAPRPASGLPGVAPPAVSSGQAAAGAPEPAPAPPKKNPMSR